MMKRTYLGAVNEEEGVFGISFLDFPGCISVGDSLDEVVALGTEALSGHIAAMLDAGEAIPEPTDHDLASVIDWLRDDERDTAIEQGWVGLFPITVDVSNAPGLITIRMRAELVQRIADMAEEKAEKLNSRTFIEQAVEHELDAYRKSAA